jgi:hypothetical protein
MSSPSEVVGWECGTCTYTNEDGTCPDCLACQARHLVRYIIMAGATAAAMTRMTRVDCCDQACIAALPTAGPVLAKEAATSANGAVTREGSNAAYGLPAVADSAAIHHGQSPQLRGDHASIVACLVNMMADIVGTSTKDKGCNCPFHNCCGMQLQVGSKVCFHRERLIYHEGRKEDVLMVYLLKGYLINYPYLSDYGQTTFFFLFRQGTEQLHQGDVNNIVPFLIHPKRYTIRTD